MILCYTVNMAQKIPIGSVSVSNRTVVDYTGDRARPYLVECNNCLYKTAGAKKTWISPCKRCSMVYPGPVQDVREQVYYKYKYNATAKGVPFEVAKEEFYTLISKDCMYCGKEPSNVWHPKRKKEPNPLVYSGIDRKVNGLGYVKGNLAPCCAECNYIKKTYSLNTFKEKVKAWSERIHLWE